MKAYRGVGVLIHVFLTSALGGDEWLASRPGRFTTEERAPRTHWIGGRVGPRTGVDDMEKIPALTGTRTPTPRSSSPSQSLYRLSYRGSMISSKVTSKLYVNIFILEGFH
jgi:hypothetical protein